MRGGASPAGSDAVLEFSELSSCELEVRHSSLLKLNCFTVERSYIFLLNQLALNLI